MATRNEVKPWFLSGKYPTQAQFHTLFDSIIFTEDGIAIADVTGLIAALQAKLDKTYFDAFEQGEQINADADFDYPVPQNYLLEKMFILPGADNTAITVTIQGGDTLIDAQEYSTDNEIMDNVNVYARLGAKTVQVTGVPAGSKFLFFKRKIKTIV